MSSGGGVTVLDGTQLRFHNPAPPEAAVTAAAITGGDLLRVAESEASSALLGLPLPETLKSAALNRLALKDAVYFPQTVLDPPQATSFLRNYLSAIADELEDDPIVVSALDGSTLKLFLEDEDDFAMLAENLFTELDTEDKGKISKSEIPNALSHMGAEMGVPPFSEFPLLNDIIKKHGANGEGELGQAQFAQLLQPILQDLADALSIKHVFVIQNVKIINGCKLRKLLADEKQLDHVMDAVWQEKGSSGEDGQGCTEIIRCFLEMKGRDLGLPPSEANEAVTLLYDGVFADIANQNRAGKLGKNEFGALMKEILEKFAEQLEGNPVFYDLDN